MPIFRKAIGRKTVPDKSANVYARKRMDSGGNSVLSEIPNFMDFELSPANTPDKLKSGIVLATIVGRFTNVLDWLPPRHDIEEVTAKRVGEEKVYSNYILKMSLKL